MKLAEGLINTLGVIGCGVTISVVWSIFVPEWLAVICGIAGGLLYILFLFHKDDERRNP